MSPCPLMDLHLGSHTHFNQLLSMWSTSLLEVDAWPWNLDFHLAFYITRFYHLLCFIVYNVNIVSVSQQPS